MGKLVIFLSIMIFTTCLVNAISFEDFDLAKDYSNSNNCSITIEMLEGNCDDLSLDDYKEIVERSENIIGNEGGEITIKLEKVTGI